MAITLDGLVRNATAGQQAGVSASTKAALATGAFDVAGKSIGQQMNATSVQLSPYGQVKSSFVEVQAAGNTLSTPAKISTVEDVTKAVQTFADAINNATRIINSTGNSALTGLKTTMTGGNNTSDLQNLGIGVNQDGTVSVNTRVLQNAVQTNPGSVQDTLAKLGAQAVQATRNELSGLDASGSPLSTRIRTAATKTSVQLKSTPDTQNNAQATESSGNTLAGGVAAYMQMVSL